MFTSAPVSSGGKHGDVRFTSLTSMCLVWGGWELQYMKSKLLLIRKPRQSSYYFYECTQNRFTLLCWYLSNMFLFFIWHWFLRYHSLIWFYLSIKFSISRTLSKKLKRQVEVRWCISKLSKLVICVFFQCQCFHANCTWTHT